jgi:hypothetical protein
MPWPISAAGAPSAQAVRSPVALPTAVNRPTFQPARKRPTSMISPTYQVPAKKIWPMLEKNPCQRSVQLTTGEVGLAGVTAVAGVPCQTRSNDGAPRTMTSETRQNGPVNAFSPNGVSRWLRVAVTRVHIMAAATAMTYVEGWWPRYTTMAMAPSTPQ